MMSANLQEQCAATGRKSCGWVAVALCCGVIIALIGMGSGLPAHADENAEMPRPGQDFSADRLDAVVFGWKKDFSELAVLGAEVHRFPGGRQRGEAFLLIYPIDSAVPKHNIQLMTITHADLPHDPLPVADYFGDWMVGDNFEWMFPKRPVKKPGKSWMSVETWWDFFPVEEGICQPVVGFLLKYKAVARYQMHQPVRLRASCELLRQSEIITKWAKPDLAAVTVRFDYSPNKNERSARFPFSVAWQAAREPTLVVQSGWPRDAEQNRHISSTLKGFGKVVLQPQPLLRSSTIEVLYRPEMRFLAERITGALPAGAVSSSTTQPLEGDVLVRFGPPPEPISPTGGTAAEPQKNRAGATSDSAPPTPDEAAPPAPASKYLNDWKVP